MDISPTPSTSFRMVVHMPELMVVGISGKSGAGKDYVADHALVTMGFRKFSMAWHMKAFVVGKGLATFDEVFHTKPPHVRTLLQEEGTERGRLVYGEDVWCRTVAAWIRLFSEEWGEYRFVIPDIRFNNELEMVYHFGGKLIRVEAPCRVAASALTPDQRAHASETSLDEVHPDLYVLNDYIDEDAAVQHTQLEVQTWWPTLGED